MAASQAQPSPEFRFVCAACRWPRAARDEAVKAAARTDLDWRRVGQITQRHRVSGLVADAVRTAGIEVPAAFRKRLSNQTERIARDNLSAAAETRRLGRLLDEAGIDWITFKGVPLSVQAYGTLSLKASHDIDILIPPEAGARAAEIVRSLGYVRYKPGPTVGDDRIGEWMLVSKESGWRNADQGLIVELHSRLLDNPRLLPGVGLASPRQNVTIAKGIDLPTLGDAVHLPYLFAHGARAGWFRLKWLADVAALLAHDPAGPEARYRQSQALGVGRCAAQGLMLAHELLGLELPEAFKRELYASRVHRRLVSLARSCLAGKYEAEAHVGPGAPTMLPVRISGLLLRPGLGYKLGEVGTLATNPADRANGRLPKALGFLYPVLGGVRWSRRMLGLVGRR